MVPACGALPVVYLLCALAACVWPEWDWHNTERTVEHEQQGPLSSLPHLLSRDAQPLQHGCPPLNPGPAYSLGAPREYAGPAPTSCPRAHQAQLPEERSPVDSLPAVKSLLTVNCLLAHSLGTPREYAALCVHGALERGAPSTAFVGDCAAGAAELGL